MKNLKLIFILLSISLAPKGAIGDTDNLESVPLYVGIEYDYKIPKDFKDKKLKFDGAYLRYTQLKYNSNTGILRFSPKRAGLGVLNIKDSKGRILKKLTLRVGKTDLQQTAVEIQSLLKTVDGIQIKVLNNKVVVDGEILVPRDMIRIHEVVKEYEGKATSFVTLSPLTQNKVAKFIEKEINDPNITVRATNSVFILEGFVSSATDKDGAYAVAELYIPDIIRDRASSDGKVAKWQRRPIINRIRIREKKSDSRGKLIQLIVHYVELNKDYSDNFRFQWTPQIDDGTKFSFHSGNVGLGTVGGIISGTVSNFLPKLNWAKSFGFARILHSANVVTEENKSATIASTKTTPFLGATGPNGETTTQVETTGIELTITPKVVGPRGNSVQLTNVSFSVRNPVGSSGGKPIVTERSLNTNLHVQSGLSAVMGGIITNETFSDYNREPPNIGSAPLLTFLSSKKANRAQSQFIVFVTPIIKSSASSGVNRIKRKFKLSSK